MIYCDTAYLLKYYLEEPGSDAVTELIDRQTGVASLSLARLELQAAFHRKLREGRLDAKTHRALVGQLADDHRDGLWTWLTVDDALLDQAAKRFASLPATAFLRASDALHLACAKEHGFREIYSNDPHLLAAAKHFGLKGKNVIR
jgi:predicted nucleic acid-binding protein